MHRARNALIIALAAGAAVSIGSRSASQAPVAPSIVVRIATNPSGQALDGRLLLLISKDTTSEPRFQISATSPSTAQVFGSRPTG